MIKTHWCSSDCTQTGSEEARQLSKQEEMSKEMQMPEMRELLNDGRVHFVQGPMCHWRLASTGDGDEQGFVRGKTRWATSSSRLATLLARERAGENRRLRSIGRNEMIAASMYSPRLVNEALRALGKQLVDDGRLDSVSLYSAGPTADFPELDTQEWQEDDYDQQGNLLDPIEVKEGKREEIEWVLKQKLFDYVPRVNVRNDKVDLTH